MGGKSWTEEEIQYLKNNYQVKTTQEMATYLGKKYNSIYFYVSQNIKEKGTRKKRPSDSYFKKYETKIGDIFGKLTVKELYEEEGKWGRRAFASCQCVCGKIITRSTHDLHNRESHSCGCRKGRNHEKSNF